MKKLFVLVFAIVLCLGVLCVGASADYSGTPKEPTGSGTAAEPYQIGTAEELYWFAGLVNGTLTDVEKDTDAHAVLTDNITINTGVLKTDGSLNSGSFTQWAPICGKKIGDYDYTEYTGTFDGQGYTISGLYYDGSGKYVGLFGYVGSDGQVKNVNVADSYISNSEGTGRTGGVCGYNSGTIMNCSFSGSVTGTGWLIDVGGVCGASLGTIENCRNSGSVTGSDTDYGLCVGGVCGANYSTITNCCNSGSVTGSVTGVQDLYVGGVCGRSDSNTRQSTITNCYNTGDVTGTGTNTYVGGVCGSAYRATITNCYNTGSVTGSNNGSSSLCVGGVCGNNYFGTITNCYWLSGTASDINATEKTAEEFASGEVAWLLNRYQENGPWRQTLSEGNDNYPTLDSTQGRVFQVMLDKTDCYCNGIFTIPASPSRPGYTFDEWNTAADGTGTPYKEGEQVINLTTEPNGTVTLYAQWTANEYTVTFDPNGGEGIISSQSFTYDTAQKLTGNGFTRTGYTFDGWKDDYGNSYFDEEIVENLTSELNGNVTLYAQWKANSYSVSLNLNGGRFADGAQDVTSYTYGAVTLLPDVTRSGYRFEGWYADEEFQDGPYTEISAADLGNKTFYARWSFINIPDPNGITVTQPENGTVKVNPSNGSAGTLITVTATPDEGYELAYITVDGEKITGNTFRMPDKAVTVSAVFVPVTFPFTDVTSGDWFYDYVAYVYSNGLMDGTSATTFEPNANMTRAMVWAILARIDGETVTGAAWATNARAWAMAEGVSDGTDPNGLVTREQFATMLYRYAVAKGYDVSIGESTNILSYADFASISEYAIPAMQWACGSGIVTGVTDSTLAPQGTATRAQCAAMLMRFVEL